MRLFSGYKWWILGAGKHWQQWARLGPDGRVSVYDPRGRVILKAKYPSRFRAATALRRRGFHRMRRSELAVVHPPPVE